MLSKPVTYWVNAGTATQLDLDAYIDGSPIDRNILIFLMCAGLFVLLRRRVDWSTLVGKHSAVWIFYAYAFLSVSWSDYPLVSLKRLLRDLGSVEMILILITDSAGLEAVRRVFVRLAVTLVPLSVLFIKYYPAIGRYTHRWSYETQYAGVTTNKNSLGVLAMVGGLFLLWHITESWKGRTYSQRLAAVAPEASVLVMCVWILNIANSATSFACFVLGAVVFIACRSAFNGVSIKKTVTAVIVIALFGWLALLASELRGFVAQSLGRAPTLTERTDIWAAALALRTNPIIGTGFASFWLSPEGWGLSEKLSISHSHNGYLETYLNGGVVGVVLLVAVLLLAVKQAARHLFARTPAGAFFVAFVLSGILYNFPEVTFNNGNAVGLLLWLIALFGPARELVQTQSAQGRLGLQRRAIPALRRPASTTASFRANVRSRRRPERC